MEIRIVIPDNVYEEYMNDIEKIISECEEALLQYISDEIYTYEVDE